MTSSNQKGTGMWTLIVDAVRQSTFVEQFILYLLVAFSIVSWALILMKIRSLRAAKQNNERFLALFNSSESLGEFTPPASTGPSPMAAVFNAAVDVLEKASHSGVRHVPLSPEKLHEKVMMRMQHTAKEEMALLRWGAGFLASVGSSSPFIGLLGTVLGIMGTFHVLGKEKTATLNVVGPSISAALIATAAGLAVAIPSVMAYNWILSKTEAMQEEADTFMERIDFMTRVEYAHGPRRTESAGNNGGESKVVLSRGD